MMILFTPPRGQNPPNGKLADAVLQFTDAEGELLEGLELQGFSVWKRRDGSGLFMGFPGREYQKDGQRKTYDFLRYTDQHAAGKLENLKALILEQYETWAGERR